MAEKPRLDWELVNDALRDEDRAILTRTKENVDKAVTELVRKFKDHAERKAEEFRKGQFPQELQVEVDRVLGEHAKAVDAATSSSATVARLAAEALAAAGKAGEAKEDLQKTLKDVKSAADALETQMKEIKAKAEGLGRTTGGAVAGSLMRLFSGAF